MKIIGVLEKLTITTASGWVKLDDENIEFSEKPIVNISIAGIFEVEIACSQVRHDITNGYGFSINISPPLLDLPTIENLSITSSWKGLVAKLSIWKPLELALRFSSLNPQMQENFVKNISVPAWTSLHHSLHPSVLDRSKKIPNRKLCVITYANDAGAWFPYFYKYYSKLIDPSAIYVVTPKPESFNKYRLGGSITCSGMIYDDKARAQLVSGLATGLQAYYEWTLVCDVDEIVIPHPCTSAGFFQLLDAEPNNIILARGFDVVQTGDETDFSFNEPVLNQRRLGIPNTAICKPHLARAPIQYSGGFHYCNQKLKFSSLEAGFLTLHLKWACNRVRSEVAAIVAGTTYAEQKNAVYSMNSVASEFSHPSIPACLNRPPELLDSISMKEFEQSYSDNLIYNTSRGLWIGEHVAASFFVDLGKY